MKTILKTFGYTLAIVLFLSACKDDGETGEQNYSLRGKVEKGPFMSGSKVTVYELTSSLERTGRSFAGLISSNDGSFAIEGIQLVSPYVLLDCTGYYFNEVSGHASNGQLDLMALVELEENAIANVNILTHLERQRVEKLIGDGKSFAQAKEQAGQEVLAAFGLSSAVSLPFEHVELCGSDPALLVVSAIVQGYRNEATLTKLLSDIGRDIAETGTLSDDLKNSLANDAALLSGATIRQNLETYYQSLGNKTDVPDCSAAIENFTKTNPAVSSGISYPANGKTGINLLSTEPCRFSGKEQYEASLAAELSVGRSLRVSVAALCSEQVVPATDTTAAKTITVCTNWVFEAIQTGGWTPGVWNEAARSRDFSINGPATGDLHIYMNGKGDILINIYENNSATPTRQKIIELE